MGEFDSPWKEALDFYLVEFVHFFFPNVHANIDWSRGYEVLDKEFQKISREAATGKRLADKLFKVWRSDGQETWVLIHIEIQAQPDADFAERMFVYHYRIFDRYRKQVVNLAVLGDERENWRPDTFQSALWGCEVSMRFPSVKLLDFAHRQTELEESENPFGLIVLAHLQSQATRDEAEQRRIWKVQLVKALLNSGLSAEDVRKLFRLIDWFLELPAELEQQFAFEIDEYQKESKMSRISTIERWAMEKGREEGREEGREVGREEGREEGRREALLETIAEQLDERFGDDGKKLMSEIEHVADYQQLRALGKVMWTASFDKVREEIAKLLP